MSGMARSGTDGDGWTSCALGHRHWGAYGAAGLLVRVLDADGTVRVLLQHRAVWSHNGGTWGVPGGARLGAETAEQAALRETAEEAGLEPEGLRVRGRHTDHHGGWAYDTVVADAAEQLPVTPNAESAELRWVPELEIADLILHPGFAATWPLLRAVAVTLVVDAANVVGSRPDGWWRDREGATRRLRDSLEVLRGRTCRLPDGGWAVVADTVLVVEGAARGLAGDPDGWVRVVTAPWSGDEAVVQAAGEVASPVVVSADRGLRRRVHPATVAGPRWLLELAEPTRER